MSGTIGLIGLGLVGQAIAGRLASAGFELVGFDREASACEAWAGPGRRIAASPAALSAQCQRAVLAVFDTTSML
jgi:3-hydroxyisobutyrate dehydrogenase-like beta-hydroxyacid dehydrogenase